jgi:homoserine O-acetyltransferase
MSDPLSTHRGSALLATAEAPFELDCGAALASLTLAYETFGALDDGGGNAILVCHALTGSAQAAGVDREGRRGWWDGIIGPGKALDTDRYFVVCSNILGGCYGSTGPTSIDPATGEPYGSRFPSITIRDMVRAQRLLLRKLGVERLHAAIGGSMGGMQVLEWGLLFPDDVDLLIPVATCAQQAPWRIGFSAIARAAIELGRNAGDEGAGLALARMAAMMTYRSDVEFSSRFGRRRDEGDDYSGDCRFAVENYLLHQGAALLKRFDAATYETLLRAMDLHDVTRGRAPLAETLSSIRQPTLCMGITSDILYPRQEQQEIARLVRDGSYCEISSIYGHDAFLIEHEQMNRIVGEFLVRHSTAGVCRQDGDAFFVRDHARVSTRSTGQSHYQHIYP